jgi:hypothetical protein
VTSIVVYYSIVPKVVKFAINIAYNLIIVMILRCSVVIVLSWRHLGGDDMLRDEATSEGDTAAGVRCVLQHLRKQKVRWGSALVALVSFFFVRDRCQLC